MTIVRLGDFLEVQAGFAFKTEYFTSGEGIPLIRIRDLDKSQTVINYSGEYKAEFIVNNGDYLIGMDGSFRCYRWQGSASLLNQRVCRLQNFAESIVPEYVFYGIQKKLEEIESNTSFVTVKHLSAKQVQNIEMPLPPLSEQHRIVDLLSRAEGIVRLRREAEKKTAELIPALFSDLFGDPAMNPKGWGLVRLGDLAEKMSDGPFGSNLKSSHYVQSGVRVFRLQNIGVGRLINDVKAFVSNEHFASLPRHRCLPGDVIIGTLGDPNLRAFVMPEEIAEALNKADCVQFRCRLDLAEPAYICWLMNMPSTLLMAASLVQGITLTRISMGRLRELLVPIPPRALQNDFAKSIAAIESIQSQQSAATGKAQAAFEALLANTFGKTK